MIGFLRNFFDKIRASFSRFMSGRYGVDQLGNVMLWTGLILSIIGSVAKLGIVTILADVLLIVMFFRMLSKDRYRRAHENQVYLQKTYGARKEASEWLNRMKNSKKYRYFVCPKCKKRLRVPRGVGKVTITCKDCGTKFDKKA